MGHYIDGFVLPVPKKNVKAYIKVAKLAARVWMEYGALEYIECMGDDILPGKLTSFPQSVKLKSDEVVFFSYIVYKSKSERNKILKKVMLDPRLQNHEEIKRIFDTKRMFWGGFKQMVKM